jgi:hypothetical protein
MLPDHLLKALIHAREVRGIEPPPQIVLSPFELEHGSCTSPEGNPD